MNKVSRWWRPKLADVFPIDREDELLNFKLFNQEQLQKHAKALATRHTVGFRFRRDRLLPRLKDNEYHLTKAYEKLSAAVQEKKSISPAAEWLLDNFHLIEEQIATVRCHFPKSYSRELPHLINTQSAANPRVYDIALEIIAHVDGRVDKENISSFITAYQQSTLLKLGELWAIPIMLRLALIENLGRVAHRVAIAISHRDLADHWAKLMMHAAEHDSNGLILVTADMARSNLILSNAFVAEFVHNLQGKGPIFDTPLQWIERQLSRTGRTIKDSVHQEGQQQAANQVSVSASIGSLRFLGAIDWRDFVESMSSVDQLLSRDPAKIYSKMDFNTRDAYRHAVEKIAKQSGQCEWDVAEKALELAHNHAIGSAPEPRVAHVGYYLSGNGRHELKKLFSV